MKTKKETTSLSAIIYVAVASIFGSAGQIFFKYGANRLTDIASFVFNPFIYTGLICYGFGLLFMLKGLKRGELTVIYPVMATSFIWVSLAAPYFFETDFMTLRKWIGIGIILLGVSFVSRGRNK